MRVGSLKRQLGFGSPATLSTGFRVQGLKFRGFRVWGFRVSGFRALGLKFRV